jgi:hypothetical protein
MEGHETNATQFAAVNLHGMEGSPAVIAPFVEPEQSMQSHPSGNTRSEADDDRRRDAADTLVDPPNPHT